MTLDYDITKCKHPISDNDRVDADVLIEMTLLVGINEITEKTAPEFYARVNFYEHLAGALRSQDGEKIFFTPQDVKRWIGLKTNASRRSRAQFLKCFEVDLNRAARRYTEKTK